jgi:lipopolysaccharide/colanic/teichoic acid biosynthesis glycosyltransferase
MARERAADETARLYESTTNSLDCFNHEIGQVVLWMIQTMIVLTFAASGKGTAAYTQGTTGQHGSVTLVQKANNLMRQASRYLLSSAEGLS